MILLIDNYDSFSYNLVQCIGTICKEEQGENFAVKVIRNDELSLEQIKELSPRAVILSPGPGRPDAAGVCEEVLRTISKTIPTLGVCLGHQAICEVFGAKIIYAKQLMHGKQSIAEIDNHSGLFAGLPESTPVARYHSLAADPKTMPECLLVTAHTKDGEVMAVQHKKYPIYGVQFHPESVLTPEGGKILANFLHMM